MIQTEVESGSGLRGELPTITQSEFFSPAFNAAIFDGVLRIYFAQYQEPEALKIYFQLQDFLKKDSEKMKKRIKEESKSLFIMIYPNKEIFDRSFKTQSQFSTSEFDGDMVVGLNGELTADVINTVCDKISERFTLSC